MPGDEVEKGAGTAESGPQLSDAGHRALAERRQRQAAALRANLRRRKLQQRDRDAAHPEKDPDSRD